MIVGLMSTYMEGALALGALHSLMDVGCCDIIGILDGPVEGTAASGDPTPLEEMMLLEGVYTVSRDGVWKDDAAKRNALLRWAKVRCPKREPLWCLWLDGDEVMLWGQYLDDMIRYANEETGIGGFPLRIVELDGSVAYSHNRIFRGDRVRKFLIGASQAELHTGMVVGLPNTPICGAGGIPVHPDGGWQGMSPERQSEWLARCRPPVAGEPHILHRSALRSRHRKIERQHEAEGRAFTDLAT